MRSRGKWPLRLNTAMCALLFLYKHVLKNGGFRLATETVLGATPDSDDFLAFHTRMAVHISDVKNVDIAFILAFNDWLGQASLTREELAGLFQRCLDDYQATYPNTARSR